MVSNIPCFDVTDPCNGLVSGTHYEGVNSGEIARQLLSYPYFILLRGVIADRDQPRCSQITTIMQRMLDDSRACDRTCIHDDRVSFTQVRIVPDLNAENGGVTRYSRSNLPLSLHTDSSYCDNPHNLLGFQCVETAEEGGTTLLMPVDDILEKLDGETVALLSEPVYSMGRGFKPILSRTETGYTISFYSAQLGKGAEQQLAARHRSAVDSLAALLADAGTQTAFHMAPGDLCLLNNHKVLHGRTGFAEHSRRLLYRGRARVDFEQLLAGPVERFLVEEPPAHEPASKALPEAVRRAGEASRRFAAGTFEYGWRVARRWLRSERASTEARHLMREGQFELAIAAFRTSLAANPCNADDIVDLSCILRKIGRCDEARELLQKTAKLKPFALPAVMDYTKPTIMRLRGLQNSIYTLNKSKRGYSTCLTGGHFSIEDLVLRSDFNLILHNIYNETILERASTPDFHLILNTIACADRMAPELKVARRFVDSVPDYSVINHPAAVLRTTREENYRRLSRIDGVRFPITLRARFALHNTAEMLDQAMAGGLNFPFIVRPTNTHTGSKVWLVRNRSQFSDYFLGAQPDIDYYMIEYIEARGINGLFNKTRTLCIDGVYYPIANLHHDGWSVHSGDRYSVMQNSLDLQRRELAYLNDMPGYLGEANLRRLEEIGNALQLDFFGIDFSLRPDGSLLVFECNAAMRHNFDHAGNFPYTRPFLEAASRGFNAMIHQRTGFRS